MTRSFSFTLPDTNWNTFWDLIKADSSFTDPTFETAQFVPNSVCELNITPSATLSVSTDLNDEIGVPIAANVTFTKRSNRNIIGLSTISIKGASSETVYIDITSN